jgi:hypothetical protein
MTESVDSTNDPSTGLRLREILSLDQCDAIEAFAGGLIGVAESIDKELSRPLLQKFAHWTSPFLDLASVRMSNPTPGQFLSFIGISQADLDGVVGIADRFLCHLEDARPALIAVFEEAERFVQSPPVAGYEGLLIGEGHHPYAARLLARILEQLGKDLVEQRRAERKLSSAIYAVASVEHATPLVISRRARSVIAALGNGMASSALYDACVKAGIPETVSSFAELAECAKAREAIACTRLSDVCRALKPLVVDPRGLVPSEASATHELYLSLANRGYTFDAVSDAFVDSATLATRIAKNLPKFDPRSARRRIRKKQ